MKHRTSKILLVLALLAAALLPAPHDLRAQSGSNRILWRLLPDLPVFDVRTFGATANDGTDDYAAIQAATNAAAAVRGEVFFPAGRFKTSASITSTAQVTWRGVGTGDQTGANEAGTVIERTADVVVFKVSQPYSKLLDLTIHAPTAGTADGVWVGEAVNNNGAGHCVFRNVAVVGVGGAGMWGKNGNGVELDNVRFQACGSHGLLLDSARPDAVVNVNQWFGTGISAFSNGGDGVHIDKSATNGFGSVDCEGNTGWGIWCNRAYNKIRDGYVELNTAGPMNLGASCFDYDFVIRAVAGTPAVANTGGKLMWLDGAGNRPTLTYDGIAGYKGTRTGGLWTAAAVKTANYTATTTDHTILCDTTGGTFTVTLPGASNAITTGIGKRYAIVVIAGTNPVTVATTAGQTIDGLSTSRTLLPGESLEVVGNGSAWNTGSKKVASFNINDYGAKPGDGVDDIPALNAAIAAANAAGGGIVEVPGATYDAAPSGTTTYILPKSNVTVRGAGPASKLKIKDNCGDYRALFYDNGVAVSNFAIEDLTIDQNPTGNTTGTVTTAAGQLQLAVFITNGTGIRVRRCRFAPCTGVNTVDVNGTNCSDVRVEGCYFNFVPRTSPASYDNSTVYVEADNYVVSGNTFETAQGSGARGAIELHDAGGVCTGNVTNWYRTLCNVVSTSGGTQPNYNGHTISGNTANNCNDGIALWPLTGTTLRGVIITGNNVNLAQATHAQATCMGIGVVWDAGTTGNVEGLNITGNVVVCQDEGAGRAVATEYLNNGIRLAPYGGTADGVICTGNTIIRAPGPAIRLSGTQAGTLLKNFRVGGNVVIDAGQNAGITNAAYRTAFFFDAANISTGEISGNQIIDTGASSLKGVNAAWIGAGTTGVTWRDNPIRTASGIYLPLTGFGVAGLTVGNGRLDVRADFGARGDGTNDDSAHVSAASAVANTAAGTEVFFPAGTYALDNVTLYSNVRYNGVFGASVLKLKASSPSGFLLRGNGAAGLMGGSTAGGIVNTVVENLILDGNKANNTAGVGIQLYGYGYTFRNLIVRNFDGHGIESDWNGGQSFGQDGPEAQYENVKIHDCDGQGLRFAGPHDTKFADCVFFRNNVNLYVGANAVACQFKNFHSWSPTTQGVVVEGGYGQWANCAIEGAGGDRANFVMLGGGGTMAGVHFYGTDGSGSENATGLQLGQTGDTTYGSGLGAVTVTGAKQATGMNITAAFDHCGGTGGALNFVNEANNTIRARFFQNQGTYTGGTPSNSTGLELDVNGLTADGTLALSGVNKIGLKANQALVVTDKAGSDKFNVNTNAAKVEVPNNAKLFLYSSGYSANTAIGLNGDGSQGIGWNNSAGTFDAFISRAAGGVVKSNGTFADSGVNNAGAIASSATLAVTVSSNAVGTIRTQPAAPVTSIVLATGSTNGQRVTLFNESAAGNSITFAASGTSNVADGTSDVVSGLTSRTFVWNASTSLWYPVK